MKTYRVVSDSIYGDRFLKDGLILITNHRNETNNIWNIYIYIHTHINISAMKACVSGGITLPYT